MENIATQGVKRKRYEPPKEDIATRIGGKLHHDAKEVRKAAKKAKTFETQKLVKKVKGLRSKDEHSAELADSEAQLEILKELAHDSVANTALKTKIKKVRILAENEHVTASVAKELDSNLLVSAAPGTPAAKVQSRLLSSKILAVEVATVVENLRRILEPPKTEAEQGEGGRTAEADGTEAVEEERPKKIKKFEKTEKKVKQKLITEDDEGGGEVSLEDQEREVLSDAGWESGTVDDEGGEDDGWESGSVDGGGVGFGSQMGDEDEDSEDEDESDEELRPAPKSAPATKKPAKPAPSKTTNVKSSTGQSTFLPSLSVGFIRGGSEDSEWSESEAKIADIDPKKNRRGQRARRAIWEKKFGRNANHKKQETEAREASARGKAQRRADANAPSSAALKMNRSQQRAAAFGKSPGHAKPTEKAIPQHHQQVDSGWAQRSADNHTVHTVHTSRPSATSRKEERGLHPSWEAKKKLKEKESAGIVPSQGKKIKF